MLALCAQTTGSPILWLRSEAGALSRGHFYALGFAELGGDPNSIILAIAPDESALLRSLGDAARCAGLGAIIAESLGKPRRLDLTTSRKLALATEKSGVPVMLLRNGENTPSAADTRWLVRAAHSVPLEAKAPGHPVIEIELLRRRAGPAGMKWRVEWNRDQRIFRERSISGDLVSFPFDRPAGDRGARAA